MKKSGDYIIIKSMKKSCVRFLVLTICLSLHSYAALPTATSGAPAAAPQDSQQAPRTPYGAGLGGGASPTGTPPPQDQRQSPSGGNSFLLWLFTGSDLSTGETIKNGFRSTTSGNFGDRFKSVLGGALFQFLVKPIEAKLDYMATSVEAKATGLAAGAASKFTPRSMQDCYECLHPSANPNAPNPHSVAPLLPPASPVSQGLPGGIQ